MMYLLTQKEYDDLLHRQRAFRLENSRRMQDLCTRIADTMPITWTWGPGHETPHPWGCILTKQEEWYCDDCPVQEICPYPHKRYSQ